MRHPNLQVFQCAPKIGTNAWEFTNAHIKTTGVDDFLYHAITIDNDGKGRLSKDGERIDGFFLNFDGINSWDDNVQLIYTFQSRGQRCRNGTATGIPLGNLLVGAERSTKPANKTQYGYVKPFVSDAAGNTEANIEAAINAMRNARGRVVGPVGGAHAVDANTYPPADCIVRWGFE